MKNTLILSLIVVAGILMSFQLINSKATAPVAEGTTGIHFQTGKWEEVKALAKKENKLIFIDVYASWCGPCKRLKATTFSDEKVGKLYNEHFINVAFDGEKGEGIEIARQYKVTAYPTLLFVKPDGSVVKATKGFYEAPDFIKLAEGLIK